MSNLVVRGMGHGTAPLLVSGGLGAAPVAAAASGGAFWAEPDRRLEKQVREWRHDQELIKQQITDHIRAAEHAKPQEERKRPTFTLTAARDLARRRQDTATLVAELDSITAALKQAEQRLTSIRQEEDDIEVILLQ